MDYARAFVQITGSGYEIGVGLETQTYTPTNTLRKLNGLPLDAAYKNKKEIQKISEENSKNVLNPLH